MVRKQKFGYYYYNEVEKHFVKNCNKETKNMYQILAQNFVECIDPCSTLFFTPILDTIDHNFNHCKELIWFKMGFQILKNVRMLLIGFLGSIPVWNSIGEEKNWIQQENFSKINFKIILAFGIDLFQYMEEMRLQKVILFIKLAFVHEHANDVLVGALFCMREVPRSSPNEAF